MSDANTLLGLPTRDSMQKVAVCFDVDGTLITNTGFELPTTTSILLTMFAQSWKNVHVIVWSDRGADYARRAVQGMLPTIADEIKYYGKEDYAVVRKKYSAIVAIDDIQSTNLGDVNLIVRNK